MDASDVNIKEENMRIADHMINLKKEERNANSNPHPLLTDDEDLDDIFEDLSSQINNNNNNRGCTRRKLRKKH